MLYIVHLAIVGLYLVLPVVALVRAMRISAARKNRIRVRRFWLTCFGGIVMGVLVCGMTALAQRGRVSLGQVLIASYLATALLLLLKGFDHLLNAAVVSLLQLRTSPGAGRWYSLRSSGAMALRAVVLFGVGFPYVLAASTTYRPKVETKGDPQTLYHWQFEPVSFYAMDGTKLAGWWIPARQGRAAQTVLLCHGLGGNKASQLALARRLLPAGYNILAFDFRGTGESGGQQSSFGVLEKQDVLGAVRWLMKEHSSACRRVVGLGASTGGAALISAAAEPTVEGRRIDALAVYGSFDRLEAVADSIINDYVPPPMNWCMRNIGISMASAQVGADLRAFAPAEAAKKLWPRPILVVHGVEDEMVGFDRGQALFDAAMQPKYGNWIDHGGHEDVINSDAVARFVRHYFDAAGRWL